MMPFALITAITRQGGSYLTERLLDKGYQVHGVVHGSISVVCPRVDHLDSPHLDRLHLHYGDLGEPLCQVENLDWLGTLLSGVVNGVVRIVAATAERAESGPPAQPAEVDYLLGEPTKTATELSCKARTSFAELVVMTVNSNVMAG